MTIEDNLKTTLEQYLSIAKDNEKNHDMEILMKYISHFTGCEKELMLKTKDKVAKRNVGFIFICVVFR